MFLPPWPFPSPAARHRPARVAWALPGGSPPAVAARAPAPATASADAVVVDRLDAAAAGRHREAWIRLAGRALEPNPSLDPDFALGAARHLGAGPGVSFLFAWSDAARAPEHLVGVLAVARRRGFPGSLASAWFHDLSANGIPLLDRERAAAALRHLLLRAGRGRGGSCGLVLRALPAEGPTARILRAVAAEAGLDLRALATWDRAVLRRGSPRAGLAALSPKGAKDLRRQGRRLAERGVLAHTVAQEGDALREGVEGFLALEAAGWKGKAGTAFLARPDRTAFLRALTRLLARRGLCRVDALTLDGLPIAMALVLRAGRADYLWKIAYREDLARFSPGVQLVLRITEAAGEEVDLTDSCAVPDHPMIDRLWRDRLRLLDVAVSLRPGRPGPFAAAVAAERAARGMRAAAKRAFLAWRGRRRRAARPGAREPA